jgi:hypothetical protein
MSFFPLGIHGEWFLKIPNSIAEFERRRNSSKCLARGSKGDLAREIRPCDKGVFAFMEMRRERRWEGKQKPAGKVSETRAICGELSQARRTGRIGIYG